MQSMKNENNEKNVSRVINRNERNICRISVDKKWNDEFAQCICIFHISMYSPIDWWAILSTYSHLEIQCWVGIQIKIIRKKRVVISEHSCVLNTPKILKFLWIFPFFDPIGWIQLEIFNFFGVFKFTCIDLFHFIIEIKEKFNQKKTFLSKKTEI